MKCIRLSWSCDRRIPIKLKGKFYKTKIRPVMLYGTKCWTVKKQHIHKMSSWTENLYMDKWKYKERQIQNEENHLKIGVTLIDEKMRGVTWNGLAMFKGEWLMYKWVDSSWGNE